MRVFLLAGFIVGLVLCVACGQPASIEQFSMPTQNNGQPAIPGRNNSRFEARAWLTNNKSESAFAGNRFGTTQQAVAFVNDLYSYGATHVFVTSILEEEWRIKETGGPYADALIVVLPSNAEQRRNLFAVANKEAEAEGFAAEPDIGQSELFFWWD